MYVSQTVQSYTVEPQQIDGFSLKHYFSHLSGLNMEILEKFNWILFYYN